MVYVASRMRAHRPSAASARGLSWSTGSCRNTWISSRGETAEAVGIQGATLTHHLNAMESAGLLTRRRHPDNRRIHIVELTEAGDAMFHRLRTAAVTFDQRRLRAGVTAGEIAVLEQLLDRLRHNVSAGPAR
jgi:MarR family transcriptional regulator for hemolysin